MRVHDNRAICRNVETEKCCNSPKDVSQPGVAKEQVGQKDRRGMADRCGALPAMVGGRVKVKDPALR